MKQNPVARTSDLVVQSTINEILIYNLKTNQAFCLNKTSACVWNLCDGFHSITEIGSKIGNQEIVWLALDELNKHGLLLEKPLPSENIDKLSRREIIRKAGLASTIALPFVTSLIAPKSIEAQSTFICTPTCTTSCARSCACLAGVGNGNTCGRGVQGVAQECDQGCLCKSNGILIPPINNIEEGICV